MRILIPALFALIGLAILWALDIPKDLGAHPWWSQNVILYGGPAGVASALLMALTPIRLDIQLIAALGLTIAAVVIARNGGFAFAASYADDTAAGQRWFFGWITAAFGAGATMTTLAQFALNRSR